MTWVSFSINLDLFLEKSPYQHAHVSMGFYLTRLLVFDVHSQYLSTVFIINLFLVPLKMELIQKSPVLRENWIPQFYIVSLLLFAYFIATSAPNVLFMLYTDSSSNLHPDLRMEINNTKFTGRGLQFCDNNLSSVKRWNQAK